MSLVKVSYRGQKVFVKRESLGYTRTILRNSNGSMICNEHNIPLVVSTKLLKLL